jgi:hypothetical protein
LLQVAENNLQMFLGVRKKEREDQLVLNKKLKKFAKRFIVFIAQS